jgi:ERCC4-type nuclease
MQAGTILIDTREQRPYNFEGAARIALPYGDYSVAGISGLVDIEYPEFAGVSVERKTVADLFLSTGKEHSRVSAAIHQLVKFPRHALLVEASIPSILSWGGAGEKWTGLQVIKVLMTWQAKLGLNVIFASDRAHASKWCYAFLQRCWDHRATFVPMDYLEARGMLPKTKGG